MKYLNHLRKRGLALFLALTMCLSLVQVTAFANEDLGEGMSNVQEVQNEEIQTDVSYEDVQDTEDEKTEEPEITGETAEAVEPSQDKGSEGDQEAEEVSKNEDLSNAAEDEGDKNVSDPADEEEPEADPAVAWVQSLIDALPAAEEITAENKADVQAQLDNIDAAKAALTSEQLTQLDWTRYEAAAAALESVQDAVTAEEAEELTADAARAMLDKWETMTDSEREETLALFRAAGSGLYRNNDWTTVVFVGPFKWNSTFNDYGVTDNAGQVRKNVKTLIVDGTGGPVDLESGFHITSGHFWSALENITLYNVDLPSDSTAFAKAGTNYKITLTVNGGSIGARAFTNSEIKTAFLNNVRLGEEAFSNSQGLEEVVLNNVGNIPNRAFYGCTMLTEATMSGNIPSIGEEAFSCGFDSWDFAYISSLKKVTLSSSTTVIGTSAFAYCNKLEEISLTNIATIGNKAFYSCTGLKSIELKDVSSVGDEAFGLYTPLNENYDALEKITLTNVILSTYSGSNSDSGPSIYSKAPFYKTGGSNTDLVIDGGTIGQYSLSGIRAKSAQVSNTSIPAYAFYNCPNLESVTLSNVPCVEGYAFYSCKKLAGTTIVGVPHLGYNADPIYGDIYPRMEAIFKNYFKLDSVPNIVELTADSTSWDDSRTAKSVNPAWNSYDGGTQLVEQARWTDGEKTEAKVQVDAYYTAPQQMDFIFVVDLTPSMARFGNADDANARFYDMQSKMLDVTDKLLNAGDGYDCRVAFTTFGGSAKGKPGTHKETGYFTTASEAAAFINSMTLYSGNTDYQLGLDGASALLNVQETGRKTTVIFMSDGQPNYDGGTALTTTTLADYREKIGAQAKAIQNQGVEIYGVLHSVGTEEANTVKAMQAICTNYFIAHDTGEFSKAVNDAITAVYPDYIVTIPVNPAFEKVRNLELSLTAGKANYDANAHTITWTITGMPFTKHTLTYEMSLTKENADRYGDQEYPVNDPDHEKDGNAWFDQGGASVESPVLKRSAEEPSITYTVRWLDADTGATLRDTDTRSGMRGSTVSATADDQVITGYDFVESMSTLSGTLGDNTVLTLYFRRSSTPPPPPNPTPNPDPFTPPTIITPTPTPTAPAPGTTITDNDVPLAAPGLNSVDHFAYIIGYPDGGVHPEANITRAEVATIFFRLMTDEFRTENWATENTFPDVTAANWYNNGVSTSAKAQIIEGYEDGTFRPDRNITRAEFAAIAARFLSDEVNITGSFSDISGHWAENAINRAVMAGWIQGYTDGTFRPDQPITRAEAVTMINRMLDRTPDKDHLLPDMIRWVDNTEDKWYYADMQEATNSHDYERVEMILIEDWTELLENRDWEKLEKEWSDAASAPGGEVADNLGKTGEDTEDLTSAEGEAQ